MAPAPGVEPASRAWQRALERTARIADAPQVTLPTLVGEWADRFGPAPALLSERESLTYRDLAERSNRYACWALEQGIGAGVTVALMMPNRPEYVAVWLGITRVGGVVALLNTNLRGQALAHAIGSAAPAHIIVDTALAEGLAAVLPCLGTGIRFWVHGEDRHGFDRIDHAIARGGERLSGSRIRAPALQDRALLIYTSGTTGLPKAAGVSHFRLMQWSHWFAGLMDTRPDDRMYNCLPLYHSTGGVVAVGATLAGGGSVLIRPRFSANRFWDEVAAWDCTLFQYIGELCRYLVNSPPHPRESRHRIRLCCGNGLRAEVWTRFKERFAIPRILEFYAATEGTFSLYNVDGEPGAVGRIPSYLAHRFPVVIVRHDTDTGAPVRDADGFCVACGPDEAGEAIGQIGGPVGGHGAPPGGRFEGYTDPDASERKILRNVFARGDAWFRSGDLMRRDGRGFFRFVDRVGDTFRWKGENVAAAEVAAAIAGCPGVADVAVYGVAVPGADGRAGMAAVVAGAAFDLAAFRSHLEAHLPGYARPVFLRLLETIETTGTFKPKTVELMRQGYDPGAVTDPLFVDDRHRRAFVPLDAELHERIRTGRMRV